MAPRIILPPAYHGTGCGSDQHGITAQRLQHHEDCGATDPQVLGVAVLEHRADLGIAIDGDGDRVIMADHTGAVVDGDELLFLIAQARNRKIPCRWCRGYQMSNLGWSMPYVISASGSSGAPVGDRHVVEMLQAHSWILGGSVRAYHQSGPDDNLRRHHFCLAGAADTGDCREKPSRGQIRHVQVSPDTDHIPVQSKIDIESAPGIQQVVRDAEADLGDSGRVLLRPSGTEPLVRVMVEGVDAMKVEKLAQRIAEFVSSSC